MITALTVNYNTPDLLERLIISFRQFYNNPYLVIDGSDKLNYRKIKSYEKKFNVRIIHFPFNIHHGPGMAYGIKQINTDRILLLDSDLLVIRGGFLEDLEAKLTTIAYGIGDIQIVNDRGMNVDSGIKYLHPACALINRGIAMRYSLPIFHGAPMLKAMIEIQSQGLSDTLLIHEPWITNDFRKPVKLFISHEWQGTVQKTGGYHYN
jgi:GT2 family glycosyltransferase